MCDQVVQVLCGTYNVCRSRYLRFWDSFRNLMICLETLHPIDVGMLCARRGKKGHYWILWAIFRLCKGRRKGKRRRGKRKNGGRKGKRKRGKRKNVEGRKGKRKRRKRCRLKQKKTRQLGEVENVFSGMTISSDECDKDEVDEAISSDESDKYEVDEAICPKCGMLYSADIGLWVCCDSCD